MKSQLESDSPHPWKFVLVLLGLIVLASATLDESKSNWTQITSQEALSGKFEVKTSPGMRGGVTYWGKTQ